MTPRWLVIGVFGWVPRRVDSSVPIPRVDTSSDKFLASQKVQGVHLLMNKEDAIEGEKKGNGMWFGIFEWLTILLMV